MHVVVRHREALVTLRLEADVDLVDRGQIGASGETLTGLAGYLFVEGEENPEIFTSLEPASE